MPYTCHAVVKVVNINNATTEAQRYRGFIYKDHRREAKYGRVEAGYPLQTYY